MSRGSTTQVVPRPACEQQMLMDSSTIGAVYSEPVSPVTLGLLLAKKSQVGEFLQLVLESSSVAALSLLSFHSGIFVSKLKQLSPLQDEAFVLSDPAQSLSELNLLQEGFVFFKRCYSMDQSKQIYLSSGKRISLL